MYIGIHRSTPVSPAQAPAQQYACQISGHSTERLNDIPTATNNVQYRPKSRPRNSLLIERRTPVVLNGRHSGKKAANMCLAAMRDRRAAVAVWILLLLPSKRPQYGPDLTKPSVYAPTNRHRQIIHSIATPLAGALEPSEPSKDEAAAAPLAAAALADSESRPSV